MLTCLIVEDNPVCWMIMQNQVERLGLRTSVCTNGREALAHCREHGIPDLILLDGYMPEMDGIAFLREFKLMPNAGHAFILFCSSSLDRPDIEEALRIGADCHTPKPIDQKQLASIIDSLSGRRAAI